MRVSAAVTSFYHNVQTVVRGSGENKASHRGLRFVVVAVSGMAINFLRGNPRKYDAAGSARPTFGEQNDNKNNPLSQNISGRGVEPAPMHGQAFASGDDAFDKAIRSANALGPNVELPSRFDEGLWSTIDTESQSGEDISLHEATAFQGEPGLDNDGEAQSLNLEEHPIMDKVEAAPPVPRKTGLEELPLEPTIVGKFQTEAAHCRSDCLAANVQIFEKAFNASGDELKEKINAMETTYLESYSTILPLSYGNTSKNTSPAAALRKAHSVANEVALEDVKGLKTEDAKRYADAWSQFTINFGANGMPETYSLKPNKFASRPLPPLPVTVAKINDETEETRL